MADGIVTIDGSQGEGGGQILRTAVGLAAAFGQAVQVVRIRAGRQRPGLRPQHLSAIRAAAAVCGAELAGDDLGSMEIAFRPARARAGTYRFDIGTAGSATLLLQTIIPALMLTEGASEVAVIGGTHNPLAPCFHYLRDVFAVLASAANLNAYLEMPRAGFYPGGGGEVRMQIAGVGSTDNVAPIRLMERGQLRRIEGLSAASFSLPPHIIERQAARLSARLAEARHRAKIDQAAWETYSPGTAVFLRAAFSRSVAGFTALGARGKRAETVADEAADALLAFLDSPGTVDAFAGDQLLALAALCPDESRFVTQRVTDHLKTNAEVIRQLTGRQIDITPGQGDSGTVAVRAV